MTSRCTKLYDMVLENQDTFCEDESVLYLMGVRVKQVYAFVKTDQTVHFKSMKKMIPKLTANHKTRLVPEPGTMTLKVVS